MTKTLFRSRINRMITGVCGGIADYLNVDPSIVRLVAVVLLFTPVGVPAYIVASIIVPEQPM